MVACGKCVLYISILFPLAVLLAALNFFWGYSKLKFFGNKKIAQAFCPGSWSTKIGAKKSRDISLDLFWALYIYIYIHIHLVFQATSTSKVIIIRYNLTPYKWPKLHVFFWGVLSYNPTYNRSYNPTYNKTKDAWGEIDMGPYKWPFQWVTGVIKL